MNDRNAPVTKLASGLWLSIAAGLYLGWLGFSVLLVRRAGGSTSLDELFLVAMLPAAALGLSPFLRAAGSISWYFLVYFAFSILSAIALQTSTPPFNVPWVASALGVALDLKVFLLASALFFLCRGALPTNEPILLLCKVLLIVCALHAVFMVADIYSNGISLSGLPLRRSQIYGYVPVGLFSHKSSSAIVCGIAISASTTLYLFRGRFIYLLATALSVILLLFCDSLKELSVCLAALLPISRLLLGSKALGGAVLFILPAAVTAIVLALVFSEHIVALLQDRSVYFTDTTIRGLLYSASVNIAVDHFPFGSGAGTFASAPSRTVYFSPFYHIYGLSSHYGASVAFSAYLLDAWWPKVIGESGFLGGLGYFLGMLIPLLSLLRSLWRRPTALNVLGYLLGSLIFWTSFASSIFTHDAGILVGSLYLALYAVERRERAKSKADTTPPPLGAETDADMLERP